MTDRRIAKSISRWHSPLTKTMLDRMEKLDDLEVRISALIRKGQDVRAAELQAEYAALTGHEYGDR